MGYTFTEKNKDVDSEIIDWTQIYKHRRLGQHRREYDYTLRKWVYKYYPTVCYETDKTSVHKTIGRVLRQIGLVGECDYDTKRNRTGMPYSNIRNTIKKFMAPEITVNQFKDFNSTQVMRSIDRGLLFMYGQENDTSAHAWVADGYYYLKTSTLSATWDFDKKQWYGHKTEINERSLTHFLWGWEGLDDGYYSNNVFITSNGTYNQNIKYIEVLFR